MQPTHDPPPTVPALVISGMHRSGTSLLAAVCQSAGLDIGPDLVPAHASNPAGHFEDLAFYTFHESVLAANGRIPAGYGLWDAPPIVSDDQRRAAAALVAARRAGGRPWGWKDPRTVLFLDFWLELIPEARFLFVVRDPGEVADSLQRRGEPRFQDGGAEAFRTWYRSNSLIAEFCRRHGDRALVRELGQVVADPGAVVADVGRLLGVPLGAPSVGPRPGWLHATRVVPDTPPTRGLVAGCARLGDTLRQLTGNAAVAVPSAGTRRVAVVIPVHRLPLEPHEEVSLRQARHHLQCHDRIVVAPQSLDTRPLGLPTRRFADGCFAGIAGYSELLLTAAFYAAFEDYEHILIHQLDCLVFSSDLETWCERGWDYAGAPWFPGHTAGPAGGLWAVGNGGLSLRRVATCRRLLERPDVAAAVAAGVGPEDVFWSFQARRFDPTFTIPSAREGAAFAVESSPRYCFESNGNSLPFGCHYWPRIDPRFWETFLVPEARAALRRDERPYDDDAHPDQRWARQWVDQILSAAIADRTPEAIADLLTADVPELTLAAAPTAAGITAVFQRLLGRDPGADWFDFWVGKPGTCLRDVRRDLIVGDEFQGRCRRLGGLIRPAAAAADA